MFGVSRETVEKLKKEYPVGCRVELDYMNYPWSPIPQGTQGTVLSVDDIGTIHVSWDNGSGLGVAYGEDRCHRI